MNVAAGVLGVLLSMAMVAQATLVEVGSSIGEVDELESAAALGVVGAFLMLTGGAFAFTATKASPWIFLASAGISGGGAIGSEFEDLWIWAGIAMWLAAMSWVAGYEPRLAARIGIRSAHCDACSEAIRPDARRCRHCGEQRA